MAAPAILRLCDSIAYYISAKTRSSALMKAYVWSTNDDNASCTVKGRQGPRLARYETGESQNRELFLLIM